MSEQQLRKALGAVNDLEPPRDDLFVERAMRRGQARVHRRRAGLLGAAAALVVVAAVGGTWAANQRGDSAMSPSAGAAPEVATTQGREAQTGGMATPAMPPARDLSEWFSGPSTPVRAAMDELTPTLEARFPDVFAGMYAADAGNARIVLCVTRSDAALEAMVRSAVPGGSGSGSGSGVEYRTVAHSIRELRGVVTKVDSERISLQAKGVSVLGVRIDARTNRVVVTASGDDHGLLGRFVGGDLVTVVVDTSHTPGPMLPGGSTLPPLQR